jgi:predicted RNA polymerase sigma factor
MHEARASLLRDLGRDEDARAAEAKAAELAAKVGGTNPSAPPTH